MKYEIEYIEKLAKVLNDNCLTELILEEGDQAITIKKDVNLVQNTSVVPVADDNAEAKKEEKSEEKVEIISKEKPIISPMVGSFYASPAPGTKPYVKVGDIVSAGQIVCIVEAMKLMNEIESEVSGKITRICVEDGQSVEYGQVLMYVE